MGKHICNDICDTHVYKPVNHEFTCYSTMHD